jgi:carbon monoxide dehydrogenase subunit G
MIETDHTFVIEAPIGEVWGYAGDIGNWASSMPGYESFEAVDELRSNWVLKVALGALTRRVPLQVTITERREPEHIRFELRGDSDPVEGRGTFTAWQEGAQQTSVVVSLAIWGSGPMAATMEAMSRPVVRDMTRVVSDAFKAAVERTGPAAPTVRELRVSPRLPSSGPLVGHIPSSPSGRGWRAWLLGSARVPARRLGRALTSSRGVVSRAGGRVAIALSRSVRGLIRTWLRKRVRRT